MLSRSPQVLPFTSRHGRGLLLAAGFLPMLLSLGVSAQRAEASCAIPPPPEYGMWVNVNPNSNGITRIELANCVTRNLDCREGSCSSVTASGWAMHVWGKCWPTDCDWGWSDDGFEESGTVHGYYEKDFGTYRGKYHIGVALVEPNRLWMHSEAELARASDRESYSSNEWFVRPRLVSMVHWRPWDVRAPTG